MSRDAKVEQVRGRDGEGRRPEVVDADANIGDYEEIDLRHVGVRATAEAIPFRAKPVAVAGRYGAAQHNGGSRSVAV